MKWGPNGTRSKTSEANWKEPLKWDGLSRAERNLWDIINENPAISTRDIANIVQDENVGEWLSDMESRGVIEGNKGNLGGWLPLPWRNQRVFCASLADVFESWDGEIVDHEGNSLWRYLVGQEWRYIGTPNRPSNHDCELATMNDLRRDLFELIDNTPNLDWLLLTKRPENVREMCSYRMSEAGKGHLPNTRRENVWIGTSVSDQETTDKAIPELLKLRDLTPCLFLSVEPLIGPVDLSDFLKFPLGNRSDWEFPSAFPKIDWVIVGGESGPNARPCNVDWIQSIVQQCSDAGVSCHVKQLGSNPVYFDDGGISGNEMTECPYQCDDKKGGNINEWPEDLRVQQHPQMRT